jgi:hypothetical protein
MYSEQQGRSFGGTQAPKRDDGRGVKRRNSGVCMRPTGGADRTGSERCSVTSRSSWLEGRTSQRGKAAKLSWEEKREETGMMKGRTRLEEGKRDNTNN